jgi:hypothetical protein
MMKIAFRVIFNFKMATNKIGKISMSSDFNENWYLGLFWSEKLIGNDENCIQGHFYFQNGRWQNRQIVNGLRFQWKLISRSILKWGIGWCPEFWYGFFFGNFCVCIQTQSNLVIIILLLSFFLPPKVCLTHFSATTEWKSMKLHRNAKHYE